MSADPGLALQKAFHQALVGNTEAGGSVYDRVPPSKPFPRIIIGDGETSGRRIGQRSDPCYYAGSETVCFIDVYGGRGNEIGHPETKRIADQVRDILDDASLDLTAHGHVLEMLDFETAAYEADADGITRRALMVFRAWTQSLGPSTAMAMRRLAVRCIQSEGGLAQFETWFGGQADRILVFANGPTWPEVISNFQAELDEQTANTRPLECAVALAVSGMTLAEVAAGDADTSLHDIATRLLAARPTLTDAIPVRIGWEMNIPGGEPWNGVGNEANYIAAFRRAVDIFRSHSARFLINWCVNWATPDGIGGHIDPSTMYPGDDYVDIIGMDVYFVTEWDQDVGQTAFDVWTYKREAPFGLDWLTGFAAIHDKPIAIPEWGINVDGAQDYVTAMHDWIETNNVVYTGYWDRNAGTHYNCKLSTGAYPATGARFKAEFG